MLLLGVFVYLLWRYTRISTWQIAVCVLFGYFLSTSSVGPQILRVITALVHYVAGLGL
ncbi:hypothetical protein ABZS66_08555 [Dactylosporangium sp. NPDC005572]|uniref:hypothetical protein n=1 Tax=Dactylosporangium sp. NPDC005572 TaxID=3156889 RepID=UPI0033A0410F